MLDPAKLAGEHPAAVPPWVQLIGYVVFDLPERLGASCYLERDFGDE